MQNNKKDEALDVKTQKRKLKIIILSVFGAFLLLLCICIIIMNIPQSKTLGTDYTDALTDYKFYPVVYENIFKDPDYTEQMRQINYADVSEGIREYVITEDNINDFDASVLFMYNYIQYIINGEVGKYNACFSDAYYEKVYPKESFTMQRLYDINLYKVDVQNENGYAVYIFKLDYKILKNNGSFRRDISSDTSRTKTIYVTTREGGLAIDGEVILHIEHNEKR